MTKFLNFFVDSTSLLILIILIFLNIRFGAGSGAALIGDSVAAFILISFFSTKIDDSVSRTSKKH
ncbi:hypothetical protein [Companilactobacillus ginsenosidimutans]|uniref:Uncharacterized protein n=1 Tax=Companilactobacillus ginsenosidimutans TaxID=1007676 RepID=A0A0H4QJR2_9LACO|nr:hypothetical protein [Companilactobacillus ginsenosidimutans]AKP67276.1 hypothetical protein ABM34_06800 [Companilactobacillus ginsenosidimutans]